MSLPQTRRIDQRPDLRHLGAEEVAQWTLEVLFPIAERLYRSIGAAGRLTPPVIVNTLRGLAAGQVRLNRRTGLGEIRLNPQLWALDDGGEALLDTLAHEMAHWVVMQAGVRERSHGATWQRVARSLGCDGQRCHQLPLKRARRCREYCYRVGPDRELWVGPGVHRAIQTRRRHYHCTARGRRPTPIRRDGFTGQSRWRGETADHTPESQSP